MVPVIEDPLYKDEYYLSYIHSLFARLEHVSNEKSENALLLLPLAIEHILRSHELQTLFTPDVLEKLNKKVSRIAAGGIRSSLDAEIKRLSAAQENVLSCELGITNLLGYSNDNEHGIILRLHVGNNFTNVSGTELYPVFEEARQAIDTNIINAKVYPAASQYFYDAAFSMGGLRSGAFKDIAFKADESRSFMLGMAVAYYSFAMEQPLPTNLAITGDLDGNKVVPVEKFIQKIEAVLNERPNIRTVLCPSEQPEFETVVRRCGQRGVELKPVGLLSDALTRVFGIQTYEKATNHFLNLKQVQHNKSSSRDFDTHIIASKGLAGKNNLPGIKEYVDRANAWLDRQAASDREGRPILWISGESGVGKSQIAVKLWESLRDDRRFIFLPFFLTPDWRAISDFYRRCLYELTILFPQEIAYGEDRLKAQFLELVGKSTTLEPSPLIVVMVDGLDEIEKVDRDGEFLNLLFNGEWGNNVLRIFTSNVTRRIEQYLKRSHDLVQIEPLVARLMYPQMEEFLGGETERGGRLFHLPEDKKRELLSVGSMRKLFADSGGLQKYLDLFIDASAEANDLIFSLGNEPGLQALVRSLYERIADEHKAILHYLLSLLAIAKEPLALKTLFSILNWRWPNFTEAEIAEAISAASLFVKPFYTEGDQDTRWSYGHSMYREAFAEPNLKLVYAPDKALQDLIQWCDRWETHKDHYALRYYGDYLLEAAPDDVERYFAFARKEEFFSAQKNAFLYDPAISMKTSAVALDKALSLRNAPAVCEFTILYAKRTDDIRKSPIESYLMAGVGAFSAQVGLLENKIDQQLWRLLLVWHLWDNNDDEGAKRAFDQFLTYQSNTKITADHYGQIVLVLIAHLFESGMRPVQNAFSILSQELQEMLCRKLWSDGYFDDSKTLIKNIRDTISRNRLLRILGSELIKAGRIPECLNLVNEMNNDNYRYWLWCDLALCVARDSSLPSAKRATEAVRLISRNIPANRDGKHFAWQRTVFYLELAHLFPADRVFYLAIAEAWEKIINNPISEALAEVHKAKVYLELGDHDIKSGSWNPGNRWQKRGVQIFKSALKMASSLVDLEDKEKVGFDSRRIVEFFVKAATYLLREAGRSETTEQLASLAMSRAFEHFKYLEFEEDKFLVSRRITAFYIETGNRRDLEQYVNTQLQEFELTASHLSHIWNQYIGAFYNWSTESDFLKPAKRQRLEKVDMEMLFLVPEIDRLAPTDSRRAQELLAQKLMNRWSGPRKVAWGEARVLGEVAARLSTLGENEMLKANQLADKVIDTVIPQYVTKKIREKVINKSEIVYAYMNFAETISPTILKDQIGKVIWTARSIAKWSPSLLLPIVGTMITTNQRGDDTGQLLLNLINEIDERNRDGTPRYDLENKLRWYTDLLGFSASFDLEIAAEIERHIDSIFSELRETNLRLLAEGLAATACAITKAAASGSPNQQSYLFSIANKYMNLISQDEVGGVPRPSRYFRARSVLKAYQGDALELSRILSEEERSKARKDIAILLINKGDIPRASSIADGINTKLSELLPYVVESFLRVGQYKEAARFHVRSARYMDAAYRLAALATRYLYDDTNNNFESIEKIELQMLALLERRKEITGSGSKV